MKSIWDMMPNVYELHPQMSLSFKKTAFSAGS